MDQELIHKVAGVFVVGGMVFLGTGILTFNPSALWFGTSLVFLGSFLTLTMLERRRLQPV